MNLYKLLFVVALLFIISFSLRSQTYLSGGQVSGEWTQSGSPYVITGNIVVPDDLVLTIEPGVVVRMEGPYFLNVQGTLVANGTKNDSITFMSTEKYNMRGIKFDNSWSGASGKMDDNDTSKISFCKIIMEMISVNSFSRVVLTHSRLANSGDVGILLWRDADILVSNNQITGSFYQGIWCYYSNPLIINNVISGCGKSGNPQNGGGITVEYSSPSIRNNIITDNVAEYGAGIGCLNASSPLILNNTICNNKATSNGGAISAIVASNPEILDCIIWNNKKNETANQIYLSGTKPGIRFCDIQGGKTGINGFDEHGFNPDFKGIYENNIDLDPEFQASSSSPFQLKGSSPCIDMGISDTTGLHLPLMDFSGQPRIANSAIDIGATEFQGTPENHPPVLEKITEENILSGTPAFLGVDYLDFDKSDTHTISVTSNSGNVSILNLSGHTSGSIYEIRPAAGWTGTAMITVSVTDSRSGADSYTYPLHVSDHICGPIYGETHWNKDTVFVTCDITVQDKTRLIIDPGTVVKVTNQAKIDVYGKLSATGMAGDTILFTTPDSAGFSHYFTHKGWKGLKFHNNQSDTSVISFCKFEYGSISDPEYTWKTEENSGGAIYVSDYTNLIIENSSFYRNYAHTCGGAIYLQRTRAVIRKNKIMQNGTDEMGTVYTTLSKSVISNNEIVYNVAGNGGGIYCSDSATVTGNIICNNRLNQCAGKGGGIYCEKNPVIINNILCNNSALSNSGCSSVGGGIYIWMGSPIISNNTIGYNVADRGGAISCFNSYFTLQNCIIWGNSPYETIEGYVKMDHCIFRDSSEYPRSYGNTVHDVNPGFKNPPKGAGVQFDGFKADWSLSDTSYSVNAGKPQTDITKFPKDIIGNQRIIDGTIDLGPYEFNQQLKNRRPVIRKVNPLNLSTNSSLQTKISIWDPDQNQIHVTSAISGNTGLLVETISNDTSAILGIRSQNNWNGKAFIHLQVTDNSGQSNAIAAQAIEVTVNDTVCGNISQNTTWGPDTVRVSCNLTLDDNVLLTILPGTCIEFQDNVSFEVIGSVRALGTASQPIVFTSKHKDTGWQGIMFKNGFYAYTHPSGIMNDNDSSLFSYCNFEYCAGDVIFIDEFSKLKISNSGFSFNKSSAIHLYEASPLILQNRFTHNEAANNGSTIWCERFSNPLISGNIMSDNKSTYESILFCDYIANPVIINNSFTLNQSNNGTIQCESSSPKIINNTLAGNSAKNGGGIFLKYSTPVITNTIIWNNRAEENGNQIYTFGYSPLLSRCVIGNKENDIFQYQADIPSASYFSVSPQFVDSLSDFRLSSHSPCINTGLNTIEGITIPPYDVLGNARIADSLIDIGAYEFQDIPGEIAPIDVSLNGGGISENRPAGSVAGVFSTLDPNRNNSHGYKLLSAEGINNNNDDFYISGDTLKSAVVFDYETSPLCHILVQATDNTGKSLVKSFAISVSDMNEPPVLMHPVRDTTIYVYSDFSFTIPGNTFSKDQFEYFVYNAHLTGTVDSLPDWLHFNTYQGLFQGTPQTIQTYSIVVSVKDFRYGSQPDTFLISVIETPVMTGIESLWNELSVYPNPGTGKFYVSHNIDGELQFTVFDSMGRMIRQDRLMPGDKVSLIDLSDFPDGLYILRLGRKDTFKTVKLIKK